MKITYTRMYTYVHTYRIMNQHSAEQIRQQPPELQLASCNSQHAAYSGFCLFMISCSLLLPREVKYLHSARLAHR